VYRTCQELFFYRRGNQLPYKESIPYNLGYGLVCVPGQPSELFGLGLGHADVDHGHDGVSFFIHASLYHSVKDFARHPFAIYENMLFNRFCETLVKSTIPYFLPGIAHTRQGFSMPGEGYFLEEL
jgi:hypothetical protein